MAAFEATSPDAIAKLTNEGPASLVQQSQTQGDSVQAALLKRMRYDFVWANSSARDAQTGMVQGSRGYQTDTKTEYMYDNSAWRLATSYAEMWANSGSIGVGANVIGTLVIDTDYSTDTTFITIPATSQIRILQPGIYSFQLVGKEVSGLAMTGQSQMTISLGSAWATFASWLANGTFAGGLMATATVPFFRVTAANTNIYFYVYNDSGLLRTIESKVSIGRIA